MSPSVPKRKKSKTASDDEADAGVGRPSSSSSVSRLRTTEVVQKVERKGPPPSLPPKPRELFNSAAERVSMSSSQAMYQGGGGGMSQKTPSLYARPCDRMTDPGELEDLIQCYSFARVFTSKVDPKSGQQSLRCSRVPVILTKESPTDLGYFEFHVAHSNSQWKDLDEDREILLTFDGPHAYVSPNYYSKLQNLPTWNYASAHCLGFPKIVSNTQEKVAMVSRLVQQNEMVSGQQAPWNMNLGGFSGSDLKYIVCIRVQITKMEGKIKLSQNKSDTDYQWLHDAFADRALHSGGENHLALSQLMEMKYPHKLR